jgi:hypothetical protein
MVPKAGRTLSSLRRDASALHAYASRDGTDRRKVARKRGALLISGEGSIPGDGQHFVDSIHFTDKGSMAMADRVIAALATSDSFPELVLEKLKGSSLGDARRRIGPCEFRSCLASPS